MSVQNGLCYSYITTSHTSTLSPNPQPKCDFVDDYYRELDDDDDESRFEGNDRRSARLWGVLTGTNLLLYPDENSWLSGSMPLTSLQICSATDPPPQSTSPTFTIFTFSRTLVQCTVEKSALTPWLTSIYNGCAGRITSSNPSKTISCQPEISHFPTPTPTPSSPSQKTWSYNRLPLKSSSRTCPLTHCTFNDSLLNQFKNCVPCGRRLSSTVIIPRACPLQQYGFETPCDICIQCFGGQGILNSTSASVLWGVSERYEIKATLSAHSIICAAIGLGVNEPTTPRSSPKKSSQDEEDFVVVQQPKPSRIKEAVEGDKALEEKLSTLKTRSPVLKELMGMLRGENPITDSEFLTRLRQSSEEITTPNPSHPFLPVAEDLVTTVKALEHAATKPGPISSLKIILNYLLSLCEEQDTIKQVHLFWGQIVNIYGTIVGGVGVEAWRRVEVLEDFLLTVGVKFSEQMGLEMAWYLLGGVGDVRTWRNREFCVVKFLVEFEAAAKGKVWGRGEDVVSGRYAPSEHQEKLTHNLIEILGEQRYELNSYLSKSHKSSSNLLDSAVDSIRALIRSYVSRKVEEKDDGIEQLRNLLMLSMNNVQSDETFVDAGSVDDRLRGCGKVSGAVRTAVEMYKRRELSGAELLTIASKDLSFLIEQTEAARSEVRK
ncbi:hypothetical protein TL16_g01329 [Triparma laevis f. inornata]|uniref:Uncharacterized protein n=1 Tax=Triparma laevis f. inornata TaxID=1714386 RepID=A0A9W6ZLU6_9STRA|nr:hypothetical protein TL16_g01329 [Triparma laevis f. inornata]